jgi:hypothetical protein
MSQRGYSLIEAILASFLLLFTFFLVSSLFNTGLQYSRKVEQRMVAVQFAEKRLAEVRQWAKETDNWSPPGSVTDPADPDFPGYAVQLNLVTEVLYSPCTRLEEAFPDDTREMPTIAKKAVVTVSKQGIPDYVMAAVVTRGDSAWPATADIRLSPSTPATLTGSTQELELTARAFDTDGNEVKDIFFHWEVEPDFTGGNPTTAEVRLKTRDGRKAVVRNRVRRRNGAWLPTSGDCLVVAYARYQGHYRKGADSVRIEMIP